MALARDRDSQEQVDRNETERKGEVRIPRLYVFFPFSLRKGSKRKHLLNMVREGAEGKIALAGDSGKAKEGYLISFCSVFPPIDLPKEEIV